MDNNTKLVKQALKFANSIYKSIGLVINDEKLSNMEKLNLEMLTAAAYLAVTIRTHFELTKPGTDLKEFTQHCVESVQLYIDALYVEVEK